MHILVVPSKGVALEAEKRAVSSAHALVVVVPGKKHFGGKVDCGESRAAYVGYYEMEGMRHAK